MQPTKMGFVEAVKTCFSKAFTFTGRARRSEYWYWVLFTSLVSIPFSIFFELVPEGSWTLIPIFMVYGIWYVFNMIASFAVAVRRLHDIGRSGWWYGGLMIFSFVWAMVMITWLVIVPYTTFAEGDATVATDSLATYAPFIPWVIVLLVTLLPFTVYGIVLLVWYFTDSTPGPNKYGENPKGVEVVPMCAPSIETEESNQEE